MNEEMYTRINHEDGRVEFVPKNAVYRGWEPSTDEVYWFIEPTGELHSISYCPDWDSDRLRVDFHNTYPTEELAKKAAEYMRRNNAIVRACLLVDPKYVPDWGRQEDYKYSVFYNHRHDKWSVNYQKMWEISCPMSTKEKAQQACDLLTKWGVV